MADCSKSIRLEMRVNGELVATAGVGTFGVLTGIVSWVRRNPETVPAHIGNDQSASREGWLSEGLVVDLGGLDSGPDESVNWLRGRPLQVGDEVVIRVLPPGPVDKAEREPTSRGPEAGRE